MAVNSKDNIPNSDFVFKVVPLPPSLITENPIPEAREYSAAPESVTELGAAGSREGSWPDLNRKKNLHSLVGMVVGA